MLYLGEINDGQRALWGRAIEAFDEATQRPTQLALFAADREMPTHAAGQGVQVRLDRMALHRPRQWGACWLVCHLYGQLELDRFWEARLVDSRERTRWRHILQTLVCYRLIDPGSEWRLHRLWFEHSAMGDLLDAEALIGFQGDGLGHVTRAAMSALRNDVAPARAARDMPRAAVLLRVLRSKGRGADRHG